MKKICVIVAFISFFSKTFSQDKHDDVDLNAAAIKGLQDFKKYYVSVEPKMQNVMFMAKAKNKEIQKIDTSALSLGKPIFSGIISTKKLKNYKKGQNAHSMIDYIGLATIPIIDSKNDQLSTQTFQKSDSHWTRVGFAMDKEIIKSSMPLFLQKNDSILYVKMLFGNRFFISYIKSGSIYLIPLQDDKAQQLTKGTPYKAEVVLEKYAEPARLYNGKPM